MMCTPLMAEIYNLVFGCYLRHDLHAGQQCTAEGRHLLGHRFGGYAGKQRAAAGANYLLRNLYLPGHGNAAGAGNAQLAEKISRLLRLAFVRNCL